MPSRVAEAASSAAPAGISRGGAGPGRSRPPIGHIARSSRGWSRERRIPGADSRLPRGRLALVSRADEPEANTAGRGGVVKGGVTRALRTLGRAVAAAAPRAGPEVRGPGRRRARRDPRNPEQCRWRRGRPSSSGLAPASGETGASGRAGTAAAGQSRPDAISQLEQLDRPLLTRRAIERLFGVGKVRAAALMKSLRDRARRQPRRRLWCRRPRSRRSRRAGGAEIVLPQVIVDAGPSAWRGSWSFFAGRIARTRGALPDRRSGGAAADRAGRSIGGSCWR